MMVMIPDFDLYNKGEDKMFEIGDRVKIIRFGLSYTTYLDWFRDNNLHEYIAEYRLSDLESNKNNEIGIVRGIGRHDTEDDILLYVHLIGGGVILINEEGVELVDPEGGDKMKFNKTDLKTGMVLEDNHGERFKVLLDTSNGDIVSGRDRTWTELYHYDFNLKHDSPNRSIVKVYNPVAQYLIKSFDDEHLELIWEREDATEYYLFDEFVQEYLNYNTSSGDFSLNDTTQFGNYKSKFTDAEIEELEIPVERYRKMRVK